MAIHPDGGALCNNKNGVVECWVPITPLLHHPISFQVGFDPTRALALWISAAR
jgi:hypothetical protein